MEYRIPNLRNLAAIAAVMSVISVTSSASIVLSGSPNVDGGAANLQFTSDLTFTITRTGFVRALVFDNWVPTSDGTPTRIDSSSTIAYQINGGAVENRGVVGLYDNINVTYFSVTPTDGYLHLDLGIEVYAGQTFAINAGTLNFLGNVGFNTQAIGTFTGDVWLTDSNGDRLSDIVTAVPEPAEEAACAALGLIAFGAWRWKARRARKAS